MTSQDQGEKDAGSSTKAGEPAEGKPGKPDEEAKPPYGGKTPDLNPQPLPPKSPPDINQ